MPRADLILFREDDGTVPLLEWLEGLTASARAICFARLSRLEEFGLDLRRPLTDTLGEGIYELRAKHLGVNYRMLYFFQGASVVIVSHGFSKQEARVPTREISRAIDRKIRFQSSPSRHTSRLE
ncbi:MAG TPA: type II toxin-antitoxin system RelE/ParE family toxin [candidate division Zixibacteria bacterium]